MRALVAVFSMAVLLVPAYVPVTAEESPTAPCLEASDFEVLADCLLDRQPGKGSEGYRPPEVADLEALAETLDRMRLGLCDQSVVTARIASFYTVDLLVRSDGLHCILFETEDADDDGLVDRGWGTVVLRMEPARAIMLQAAHPRSDSGTGVQAAGIYQDTDAWGFVMAGAHRRANAADSSCQDEYHESDAAHNDDHLVQVATASLLAHAHTTQTEMVAIQFHGMRDTTCPGLDVYLTDGTKVVPAAGSPADRLRVALSSDQPDWTIGVVGDEIVCTLNGTKNVQGRLLNGVAPNEVCTQKAAAATGSFIHVEQTKGHRGAEDWSEAVIEAFPTTVERLVSVDRVGFLPTSAFSSVCPGAALGSHWL